ncbi:hypothetical protein L0U88_06020 [Flavihumibacter sp. RY-1]|uniref:Transcriptional regulator, AbiEi antitoxin, Type IV TA system n=1 Tax=Flavihumibacter fluminis TaxID=2909236 RepID=A0ABS9BEN1_9BACT|nr:hypothetical protein [Flavihumibacter fluminis]
MYRREDLERYSAAVDRDLSNLVKEGVLHKAARGVYYVPRQTAFGPAPPEDKELVRGFLKDNRFLLTSPNAYNSLGVGTSQLYNLPVVYNHKRHGDFKLGNRTYSFRVKPHFPKQVTEEFLLVDLINNLNQLAENGEEISIRAAEKAKEMDGPKLRAAVKKYGNVRTQKLFSTYLEKNC